MTRKNSLFIVLAAALCLCLAAPALAGEVLQTDEWNQPVLADGAKGGVDQATVTGWDLGSPSVTGKRIERTFDDPSIKWTALPDRRAEEPQCGSDYIDRN